MLPSFGYKTCSCPTELLAVYLDQLTAPFVRNFDSYVKDTTHMLNILDSFRFRDCDGQRSIFTMDIKSLYTVIPNDEFFSLFRLFYILFYFFEDISIIGCYL